MGVQLCGDRTMAKTMIREKTVELQEPPVTQCDAREEWRLVRVTQSFETTTLRKLTGSYYTPPEVVGPMIRLVDDVLRKHFARSSGLVLADVTLADPAAGACSRSLYGRLASLPIYPDPNHRSGGGLRFRPTVVERAGDT